MAKKTSSQGIEFSRFKNEDQLEEIIQLISNDLSEPYSIYVYRYFIHQWFKRCDELC
jgi:N-alpha-acetyltransferase 30